MIEDITTLRTVIEIHMRAYIRILSENGLRFPDPQLQIVIYPAGMGCDLKGNWSISSVNICVGGFVRHEVPFPTNLRSLHKSVLEGLDAYLSGLFRPERIRIDAVKELFLKGES